MASKTTNYGLNKHSPQDFYNVEARNENWDKIDEALAATDPAKITDKAEPADGDGVMIADSADGGKAKRLLWSSVKTALGKLFVPLARKINGKALSKDVTLTGEDIAMGADDAETLRAAMAKRPLMQYPKTLDVHKITIGQLYWCDEDTANTPYKAGLTGYTQGIALCSAGSAEEKWCSIVYIVHAGKGVWFQYRDQDGWRDWVKLASCVTPEKHTLPLTDNWVDFDLPCAYFKTQENVVHVIVRAKRKDLSLTGTQERLAYLPEGYRPLYWHAAACAVGNGDDGGLAHATIHINPNDGALIVNTSAKYNYCYAMFSFVIA